MMHSHCTGTIGASAISVFQITDLESGPKFQACKIKPLQNQMQRNISTTQLLKKVCAAMSANKPCSTVNIKWTRRVINTAMICIDFHRRPL